MAADGDSASVVAISEESNMLVDFYTGDLGKTIPTKSRWVSHSRELKLSKWCLQKISSSVLGSLDPFSMMEFIVTRLKCAEHRDWMMLHSTPRRVIINGELMMSPLVEVVTNIECVWPLIIEYIRETGKKIDGVSLVVYHTLDLFFLHFVSSYSMIRFDLEEKHRRLFFCWPDGEE